MIEAQVLGPAPTSIVNAPRRFAMTRTACSPRSTTSTPRPESNRNALVLRPGVVEVAPLLKRAARDLEPLMLLRQSVVDVVAGPRDCRLPVTKSPSRA